MGAWRPLSLIPIKRRRVAVSTVGPPRRLAEGGRWRPFTPTEIESVRAGESGLGARASSCTPPARRGGLLKWLPSLLLLMAILFLIARCHQPAADVAAPGPVVVPAVSGAAQPTTSESVPAGAVALASLIDG